MQQRELPIYRIKPGMMVAQDIYDHKRNLLIPQNTHLTRAMITKIKMHKVKKMMVYIESIKDFMAFNEAFVRSVREFKNMINDVISKNREINIERLSKELDALIIDKNTSFRVFEMLHHIRVYDDLTYVHSLNVALICYVMAKWLGFSKEEERTLCLCGLLHDVGKMKIPIDIIKKPSCLSPEEFNVVKSHTLLGYSVLKHEDISECIKRVALMHHEKCDGTGYPAGLLDEQIDDYAKIVAIADVYDAMTSDRVYRKGVCPFQVIELFEDEGFQKYNPKFLLPFLEHAVTTYINNKVRLSNQTVGRIVMINKSALSRPVVCIDNEFIDLSVEKNLKIEAVL